MQALEFYDYDQTVSSASHLFILKININSIESGPQKVRGRREEPESNESQILLRLRQAWSTYPKTQAPDLLFRPWSCRFGVRSRSDDFW